MMPMYLAANTFDDSWEKLDTTPLYTFVPSSIYIFSVPPAFVSFYLSPSSGLKMYARVYIANIEANLSVLFITTDSD